MKLFNNMKNLYLYSFLLQKNHYITVFMYKKSLLVVLEAKICRYQNWVGKTPLSPNPYAHVWYLVPKYVYI